MSRPNSIKRKLSRQNSAKERTPTRSHKSVLIFEPVFKMTRENGGLTITNTEKDSWDAQPLLGPGGEHSATASPSPKQRR